MIFRSRELFRLPVDGATRRGEDDPVDAVSDAVLQQPKGAQYVHVSVEVRLAHGAAHVYLGGVVGEKLRLELLEDPPASGADIRLIEGGSGGEVFALAGR